MFQYLNRFHRGNSNVTEKQRAAKILQILKQTLALPAWIKSKRDPFETLVVTVISQNTADRNTAKAFETLSNRIEIKPEALANAALSQVEDAIRTAGLHKAKAMAIQQSSRVILEKYGGSLQPVLSMPLQQARAALMSFSGVGPKTADVVLLFSAGQPTVPVDTHVNRVAKRLGFAPEKAGYEVVRGCLQALFDPADYLAVHLLFIAHGRKTCKALRPLCRECPVNALCPSCGKWDKP
jgi:endonuclease-3